jgi:hypothetical protein
MNSLQPPRNQEFIYSEHTACEICKRPKSILAVSLLAWRGASKVALLLQQPPGNI